MDSVLFEKTLRFVNKRFGINDVIILSNRVLYLKVIKWHVCNLFIQKWMDNITRDPIDILDDLILKYTLLERQAIHNKNNNGILIYDTYSKTLISIKNYILKEII